MILGFCQRDVIGNNYALDQIAFGPGHLSREAEVETITRVVLDNQQRTQSSRDCADGGKNGISGRRGKHLACNGCAQHAVPYVSGMRRLVAASATRDQRDLVVLNGLEIASKNYVVTSETRYAWI